ncbi:unnamed protein product [Cuscuta europaea]|uniref:Pentatricopeptide repeat-containing protein n=1 Tax=Cuscuta europaea TaxID=41803 RepID=A0A9P0YM29_CUSEU|nr:unnamed protein product [Cuscuta europaea]
MLQLLFNLQKSRKQLIKSVHFLLPHFTPFLPYNCPFPSFTHACASATKATINEATSINFHGIAKHVISICSPLCDSSKRETSVNSYLKECLLSLSCISPETVRKFWRVPVLKPQDVLQILLAFQCRGDNFQLEAKKIESLWGIFRRAGEQSKGFGHLPQSYKIMASLLVRVQLFEEVECLLSVAGTRGILLDDHEIFSNLIQGYVGELQLKKAVSNYDRMRILGLSPSSPCYQHLLEFLVQLNVTHLAPQIFADAIELGLGKIVAEGCIYGGVVRMLCLEGKVQDARNLVKKVLAHGFKPTDIVLSSMVNAYCEKKDYDDILSFFVEARCIPDFHVGNKIMHSLCSCYGSDFANSFRLKLEGLGFCSNEITFGILIGWSCREGKMKDAFIYFSEILSRNLKPQIYSYDALLSGFFKKGMWKHSQEIIYEMKDRAEALHLSTFLVLLAGYCKARLFDEVKATISQMADCGFIQPISLEDTLSKAFALLGLAPSDVKIRRDSEFGYSKAEFFDNLGNGLFLDTDIGKYETTMTEVLDNAMLPDFKSQILKSIGSNKDIKEAIVTVDNMGKWGQMVSLPLFTTLVKGICECRGSMKTVIHCSEESPIFNYHQLDHETLNTLAQAFGKKGFMLRARIIVKGLMMRHQSIENITHTVLLIGLCKKGDRRALANYWQLAQRYNWYPGLKDGKTLLSCLCRQGFLDKALELFEVMLVHYPHKEDFGNSFNEYFEQLCARGFTNSARVLVETLINRGYKPDDMSYGHLISVLCKEKKFSEAFLISETMLAKNFPLPLDVCNVLIPWLCRTGKIEKAVFLKDIVSKKQPSALFYVHCALMHGFCQSGMVDEASNLYQEIHRHGLSFDMEAYNPLVQGYSKAKNFKKIGELLGVMIRKNLDLTLASYRSLMSLMFAEGKLCLALSLKKGFSMCHDAKCSLRYLKDMMRKDLKPNNRSLREVIKCLLCNGDLEKALDLSKEMEFRGWTLGSLTQYAMIEGLLAHGNLSEAIELLDRIAQKDLIPSKINYDVLIKRFCQQGEVYKAVDLLNIMLKKGNDPDTASFDYVIQSFCSCNILDQALDFHAEMLCRNLIPNSNTWNKLTHSLCNGGRVAEAEMLIHSMVQISKTPSREMYCAVVNAYRFGNNFIKASHVLHTMQQNGYEPDFDTHWALISNLSNSRDENTGQSKSGGFLSRFLSEVGFSREIPNAKKG